MLIVVLMVIPHHYLNCMGIKMTERKPFIDPRITKHFPDYPDGYDDKKKDWLDARRESTLYGNIYGIAILNFMDMGIHEFEYAPAPTDNDDHPRKLVPVDNLGEITPQRIYNRLYLIIRMLKLQKWVGVRSANNITTPQGRVWLVNKTLDGE